MKIKDSKPLFTISIAAELTNSHPRTLMLYEKRTIISPNRTETNRRLYSPQNIAEIKFVQYLTQTKGVNLAGVKMLIEATKHSANRKLTLATFFFRTIQTESPSNLFQTYPHRNAYLIIQYIYKGNNEGRANLYLVLLSTKCKIEENPNIEEVKTVALLMPG